MTRTPSFLVWALARHCSLRQISDWQDAERTERLLRAARAFDEAHADGRVLDGVAFAAGAEAESSIEHVRGFRVDSALELFGGEGGLHAACDACPANALRGHSGRQVAGCFGMWPLPHNLGGICQQIEAMADPTGTSPAWYGLWLNSPIAGEAAASLSSILAHLKFDDRASQAGRDEFLLALATSTRGQFPLHLRHYPPGTVEGPWWNLEPHCGRCQAPWSGGTFCAVCGQTTHPASQKKRRVRGQRPYFPLVRLLGSERASVVWDQYRSLRADPVARGGHVTSPLPRVN